MKISITDQLSDLFGFKTKTNTKLDEQDTALASANNTISELSAKVEALEASLKAKADDAADTEDQEDSDLDKIIEFIQSLQGDESDDSTDDSTDESDSSDESDSTEDDTDDANDESAKKATKSAKLKSVAKSVTKLAAENKKLKEELPKQVIRELAAVGIPTPISTKVDGQKPSLTGRARVAAAFAEQLNK